jgi:hypothetical protein
MVRAGDGCFGVRGGKGTVRVYRQKFTLEDAIGSHACSLEANMRVTNGNPLGCPLLLPVDTVNCVQTLKGMLTLPSGVATWTDQSLANLNAVSIPNPHPNINPMRRPPGLTNVVSCAIVVCVCILLLCCCASLVSHVQKVFL